MKKFFYLAVVALATVFASCSGNGSSDYYKNGKEPEIDFDKATVNGVKYDNETEKCWVYTIETTTLGIKASADTYTWGTEFALVASNEEAMYLVAKAGVSKAKYSYREAPAYKNSDDCLANNDD